MRTIFVRKDCLLLMGIIILLPAVLIANQFLYGFPTANMNIKNQVSFDLLQTLALDDAQKTWGKVIAGPAIPCSDADGNLSAYMFVFRIIRDFESIETGTRFETYSEIQEGIKQGRKNYEEAMKEKALLERQEMQVEPSLPPPDEGATSPIPQNIPDKRMAQVHEKLYEARRQRWGSDKYGTIIFSATYDHIPVMEKIHGLPYFYSRMDEITQKVLEKFEGSLQIEHIYYLAPMHLFYEFSINDYKIWVNAFSDEIYTKEPELFELARSAPPLSEDSRNKNLTKWQERKNSAAGKKHHE